MTKTYLVSLTDGVKFRTEGVDFKTLTSTLNSRSVAVKLGKKGIQRQLISVVADVETKNELDKNLSVTVANEVFYLKVDDVDKAIDDLISDLNNAQYVTVADGLVFNRNMFQYVEQYIKQA